MNNWINLKCLINKKGRRKTPAIKQRLCRWGKPGEVDRQISAKQEAITIVGLRLGHCEVNNHRFKNKRVETLWMWGFFRIRGEDLRRGFLHSWGYSDTTQVLEWIYCVVCSQQIEWIRNSVVPSWITCKWVRTSSNDAVKSICVN